MSTAQNQALVLAVIHIIYIARISKSVYMYMYVSMR